MRAFGTVLSSEEAPACWDGCWWIVSSVTGQMLPAGCGRVRCPECVALHTRRLRRAMERAQPEQLVTLTRVGDDWQGIRRRVARVRYRVVRATGESLDWAWTVEANPRGTGHHVHAAKRGRFLPHAVLAGACAREGAGFPWLSPARDVGAPERYLTKYLAKGGLDWAAFLALNGSRLVHVSRGFWRDDAGDACTWREARRGDGTWIRVRKPS